MGEQAARFLDDAETEADWRFRKGFLKGHWQTRQLLEVLISQASIGDEQWLQDWTTEQMQRARMGLSMMGLDKVSPQEEELVQKAVDRMRGRRDSTEVS
jgi:hypothetical protein